MQQSINFGHPKFSRHRDAAIAATLKIYGLQLPSVVHRMTVTVKIQIRCEVDQEIAKPTSELVFSVCNCVVNSQKNQ